MRSITVLSFSGPITVIQVILSLSWYFRYCYDFVSSKLNMVQYSTRLKPYVDLNGIDLIGAIYKAVGDGPAGQAMAGPEFAISHSN